MEGSTYQNSGYSPTLQHSQHHGNSSTTTVSKSSSPVSSNLNINTSPNGGQTSSPNTQNCHYTHNGNNSPATNTPGFLNQHLVATTLGIPSVTMSGIKPHGSGDPGTASSTRPQTTSVMSHSQNLNHDGQNIQENVMFGVHNKVPEPLPLVDPTLAFQKTLRADPQFTSYFEQLQSSNNDGQSASSRSTVIEEKMFQIFKQQMGYDVSNETQSKDLPSTSQVNPERNENVSQVNMLSQNLQTNPQVGSVCIDSDAYNGEKEDISNSCIKTQGMSNSWTSTLPSMTMMAGIRPKNKKDIYHSDDNDEECQGKKKKKKVDKSQHTRPEISEYSSINVNGLGLVAAAAAVAQRTTENNVPLLQSGPDMLAITNTQPIFPTTYQGFHETMLAANNISGQGGKLRQNIDGPVSCDICGIMCANNFGLSLHKKSHVNQTFKCRECSFAAGTVTQLRLHEKYVHSSVNSSSTEVDFQQNSLGLGTSSNNNANFSSQPQQKSSIMDANTENNERVNYPFQCSVCDGAFRRKQDLTRHMQVHKNIHKCNVCQEGFPSKQKLASHTAESHQSGMFSCYQCLAQFAHPVHLQLHLNICNQSTTTAIQKRWKNVEQTADEVMVGDRDKHNVCNVCGKGFKMVHYLKSHMRTHTGERPFSCHICFKSFSQRSTLKVHNRIHTGEKPYQCSMCNKAFSVRLYLQAHIRTHTGERPYKCNICNRSFSQRSSLVTHTKRHDGF
ncbi:zinc finger protein 354C-like [Ylistrum balloti]|uniref:zinc finger protein 354C-like n=1 Tax=Ylistrum balloti TaxID=509963 RepID=UPI002905D735|nr:zinc finger protein 354C-like [Ylistrum balloti]